MSELGLTVIVGVLLILLVVGLVVWLLLLNNTRRIKLTLRRRSRRPRHPDGRRKHAG